MHVSGIQSISPIVWERCDLQRYRLHESLPMFDAVTRLRLLVCSALSLSRSLSVMVK